MLACKNKGFVELKDLDSVLRALGYPLSKAELRKCVVELSSRQGNQLEREDVAKVVGERRKRAAGEEVISGSS